MSIQVCKNAKRVSCFSPCFLSLILLSSLCFARVTLGVGLNFSKFTRKHGNLRLERIQQRVDQINKPPVISIQSQDGDIIDCVHREKQPAFDHPLLKNHTIQKVPPEIPKMKMVKTDEGNEKRVKRNNEGSKELEWQMWHQNGTRCPKGTVPIRRTTVDDVLRAKSLYAFGRKRPQSLPLARRFVAQDTPGQTVEHEHAIAYVGLSEELYGAKAKISVWSPSIEEPNEFSVSQIWVLAGEFEGNDLNSVEAGWLVSPELYGDRKPRLFTYWTGDFYQATGCYDLLCPGFVQMSNRIAVGAAISPVSSFSGKQYEITIQIWKDPNSGNWWMSYGDEGIMVGYWPSELFTHLSSHATTIEWGGEVLNTWPNGLHTSTQMGSGHFAGDGFGKSSYFRDLQVVHPGNHLNPAQNVQFFAKSPNYYDIKNFVGGNWAQHFYYGGPGRSPI